MINIKNRALTLLGTKGGPALRAPGKSFLPTSNLLCLNERKIIIDCGLGVTQALSRAGYSASDITDIFITHLHSDHVLELGGLIHTAWTSGLQHQLAVNGPAGTARVWSHFLEMMEVDIEVRVLDEGRPHLRDLVSVHEYDQGIVTKNSDFTVSALRTIHPPLKDCFALNFLSGGQKKKLVISLSLLSSPKVLLLDECFAALDVLTIKMLQEIIVNLQEENQITICICDHQARDLLACVDIAMILSNCKVIAQDTPSNLVKDINAKNAYFGNSFKFN